MKCNPEKYGVKTENLKEFPCGECGHSVRLSGGAGRTRELKYGKPDDFPMLTCEGCGEVYSAPEVTGRLDLYLRPLEK